LRGRNQNNIKVAFIQIEVAVANCFYEKFYVESKVVFSRNKNIGLQNFALSHW
jgi:hypothetical protein